MADAIDKNGMFTEICPVCEKKFKVPFKVMEKTDDPDFVIVEEIYCSKRCKAIAEETEKNRQNVCSSCGKKIDRIKGENGFSCDFKARKSYPYCDECTLEEVQRIKEWLDNQPDE